MRRIRRHLSFANVASAIALFVALGGGTAVALSGSNTVFSDDIADDTFTSGTEGQGGLVAADLRNGSVRSPEVTNSTLRTEDFSKSIPAAHATHSVNQSLVPGTTTLPFNEERYDTANLHNNATNNSRLTAPVSGIYGVTAQVQWNPSTPNVFDLFVKKNGTDYIAWDEVESTDGGSRPQNATTQVRLAAGDFVQLEVQFSGSSSEPATIPSLDSYSPELSMTWLAPGP
jgi:Tfp pilus assembly protein FimT